MGWQRTQDRGREARSRRGTVESGEVSATACNHLKAAAVSTIRRGLQGGVQPEIELKKGPLFRWTSTDQTRRDGRGVAFDGSEEKKGGLTLECFKKRPASRLLVGVWRCLV